LVLSIRHVAAQRAENSTFKVSEKPKKNENCAVKNPKDRLSRGDGKWRGSAIGCADKK